MKTLTLMAIATFVVVLFSSLANADEKSPLMQDINKDGIVDILDLVAVGQGYANAGGIWPQPVAAVGVYARFDMTKDGYISREDFQTFQPFFGSKLPLPWAITPKSKLTTTWGRIKM